MPTTKEQSWIKLGWRKIGREITYMNDEEAVRSGSDDALVPVSEKVSIHVAHKGCVKFCQPERQSSSKGELKEIVIL